MDYRITMLTVSQVIPSGSQGNQKHVPWSDSSAPITFHDPVVSTITIRDDDSRFDSAYYTPEENQQTLTEAVTFGYGATAETLPAGTQMANFLASNIIDSHGNRFVMLFPKSFQSGLTEVIGGRHSVLLLPLQNIDPDTMDSNFPVFDPIGSYQYDSVRLISTSCDSIPYPPSPSSTGAPCFMQGTVIDTLFGERPIETLRAGDMIRTRDNGFRWLSWIGWTRLDRRRLDLQPNLHPIRIPSGALGCGMPVRDLLVSPQHRVLIRSGIANRMFGETEILVAAKHLVGFRGIEVIRPTQEVTYWHMLFDGHEMVLSEGAWTESLFTGPQAMQAVGPAARQEIVTLFPHLADPDFRPQGARRFLTRKEALTLTERHTKNARDLVNII